MQLVDVHCSCSSCSDLNLGPHLFSLAALAKRSEKQRSSGQVGDGCMRAVCDDQLCMFWYDLQMLLCVGRKGFQMGSLLAGMCFTGMLGLLQCALQIFMSLCGGGAICCLYM